MASSIKSRAFRIELYEETESYVFKDVVKHIQEHYDYVCIKHDKDVWTKDTEEHKKGEPKKTHWHYVIRWLKSPRTAKGLSEELGVEERFLLPCYGKEDSKTHLKSALLYLTHVDELDKFQYDASEVIGKHDENDDNSGKLFALWQKLISTYYQVTDEEAMTDIADFIDNAKYLSTSQFVRYACAHGWLQIYRKYCSSIHRQLDEHNYHFNYKE